MKKVVCEGVNGEKIYVLDKERKIVDIQGRENTGNPLGDMYVVGSVKTTSSAVNKYIPSSFSPELKKGSQLVIMVEEGPSVTCDVIKDS